MADDPKTGKPEVKPEVTEDEPEVDKDTDDFVKVPKADFDDMQANMVILEKRADKADKDRIASERVHVFKELTRVSPVLAKANKDAELSTLKVVLDTANTMKGTFPDMSMEGTKEPKEPVAGYKLLGTKEWIEKLN